MTDAADIFIIWQLILRIRDAESVSACWMNASMAYIMVAADNERGTKFWEYRGWEKIPRAIPMGIDL